MLRIGIMIQKKIWRVCFSTKQSRGLPASKGVTTSHSPWFLSLKWLKLISRELERLGKKAAIELKTCIQEAMQSKDPILIRRGPILTSSSGIGMPLIDPTIMFLIWRGVLLTTQHREMQAMRGPLILEHLKRDPTLMLEEMSRWMAWLAYLLRIVPLYLLMSWSLIILIIGLGHSIPPNRAIDDPSWLAKAPSQKMWSWSPSVKITWQSL